MLTAEKVQDKQTKQMIPTGRVFNSAGEEVEPAYWLGKYSDMPHILSFLNESYQTIFEVLETDNEVAPLLGPFQTALKNKAMEQLEGMIGTLRVYTSRLATKESYWTFHKDGDDFDLKVSDPKSPSYLLIGNGKLYRGTQRPYSQSSGYTSEHGTKQEYPGKHHRG